MELTEKNDMLLEQGSAHFEEVAPATVWDIPPKQIPQSMGAVPAAPQPKPKKHKNVLIAVLALLLVAAMVAAGCGITAIAASRRWQKQMNNMTAAMEDRIAVLQEQIRQLGSSVPSSDSAATVPEGALTPSQVYAQNVQAVVAVSNEIVTDVDGQVMTEYSSGSGFIIDPDGYVVSNYHVIEGATNLYVITVDGMEYDAVVVGYDAANDLSVLKIEGEDFPYVTLGSSDDLIIGEQVVAIGNPLGELTSTLTVGYVSGKDRMIDTDGTTINMLQTDAAINPGNSGGPLFNMYGEVVGITTAKYSGSVSGGVSIEGLGFAIPMDDVAGMIEDLRVFGYITGAYLGVTVRSMDLGVSQTYGLPMGTYVESVTPGSCADLAGIQAKDIIVNLGGYEISSLTDLTRALRKFKAGDTTSVTVYRAGLIEYLTVTFDEKPH